MTPYLTAAEIADLTHPLTQGAARIKYIRDVLGCPVKPRPDGQPLVRRCDYEGRPGAPAANDGAQTTRNWSNFDDKVKYGRGAQTQRR